MVQEDPGSLGEDLPQSSDYRHVERERERAVSYAKARLCELSRLLLEHF